MEIMNYYSSFERIINHKRLIKIDDDDLLLSKSAYNNYLYIMDDKLRGPEIITIIKEHFSTIEYISGRQADRDKYMIFIPYKGYCLALYINTLYAEEDMTLYIYDKDKCIMLFTDLDVKDIINFLEIDRLNTVFDFLTTTLRIMYNTILDINIGQYIGKYKSLMKESIDCYIQYLDFFPVNEEYYSIHSFKNDESFLNMKNGTYTFDQTAKGTYIGLIYYFEINKRRSLFIVTETCRDDITICYYKNGQIVLDVVSNPIRIKLKVMFSLLDRTDIYDYLYHLKLFDGDIFYSEDFKKQFISK